MSFAFDFYLFVFGNGDYVEQPRLIEDAVSTLQERLAEEAVEFLVEHRDLIDSILVDVELSESYSDFFVSMDKLRILATLVLKNFADPTEIADKVEQAIVDDDPIVIYYGCVALGVLFGEQVDELFLGEVSYARPFLERMREKIEKSRA